MALSAQTYAIGLVNKRVLNAPPGTSVCLPYTRITLLWAAQLSIPTSASISAFIIIHHLPVTCMAGDLYYFPASLLKSSTLREKEAPL
jgi:hypothetical protein